MPIVVQHVIVTLAAIAAAVVFARRLFGWGAPRPAKPSCPSCEAGAACVPPPHQGGEADAKPLVLVQRPGTRRQGREA